jgi:hypothetical protein
VQTKMLSIKQSCFNQQNCVYGVAQPHAGVCLTIVRYCKNDGPPLQMRWAKGALRPLHQARGRRRRQP